MGQRWSAEHYPCGYTSYGSHDQLHQFSSQFEKLKKKLDRFVSQSLPGWGWETRPRELMLTKMWANRMSPGASHSGHIHPYSVLSGTFYLTCPPGGGDIRFEDPRLPSFMGRPQIRQSARRELQNFFSIAPEVGSAVLFESWLRHEVLPVRENEASVQESPRLSISFNYDWIKA